MLLKRFTHAARAALLLAVVNCGAPVEPTFQGRFASISAGNDHVCALTPQGKAYCWGHNGAGELGDGTQVSSATPIPVAGDLTFRQIVASYHYTCALTVQGDAYCWGPNWGNLGDGTLTERLTPTPVQNGPRFRELSPNAPSCGVTEAGAAYCWGNNYQGEVGDGTTVDRLVPTLVAGGISFHQVRRGYSTTCGVAATRDVYCWGSVLDGGQPPPQLVPMLWNAWSAISVEHLSGDGELCGLDSSGEWYCGMHTPLNVSDGRRYTQMDGGARHECAITETGSAFCRGKNTYGELGRRPGSANPVYYPDSHHLPIAVHGGHAFRQVAAGMQFSCGITVAGDAYCWGANHSGQLGDGTQTHRTEPVVVVDSAEE